MTVSTISVNGSRVAYTEQGKGAAVVLLHSSASSKSQWRRLAESLADRFRVFAVDLYGYGETDPWHGHAPLRLADEANIVEQLWRDRLLQVCDGPIHLVGHSYGGAVALRSAYEQVVPLASLTLIEPVAFHLLRDRAVEPDLFAEIRTISDAVAAAVACGDVRGGMKQFMDYWSGPGTWDSLPEQRQAALSESVGKIALDFRSTLSEDAPCAAYRRIVAPTLILSSANSPRPSRAIARLLATAIPQARHHSIASAGHMSPVTHPRAVNPAIAEHVTRAQTIAARLSGGDSPHQMVHRLLAVPSSAAVPATQSHMLGSAVS